MTDIAKCNQTLVAVVLKYFDAKCSNCSWYWYETSLSSKQPAN